MGLVERIRLIGHSYVGTTTIAIDEAGSRLSRGLSTQLRINAGMAVRSRCPVPRLERYIASRADVQK